MQKRTKLIVVIAAIALLAAMVVGGWMLLRGNDNPQTCRVDNEAVYPQEPTRSLHLLEGRRSRLYFYLSDLFFTCIDFNYGVQFDYEKDYFSPKYQAYLRNLSYDQQGGDVVGIVGDNQHVRLLSVDSLLVRFDRWAKCLGAFGKIEEPHSTTVADIITRLSDCFSLAMYCNLDSSPTFDFDSEPSRIYPEALRSIKEAFARLKPEHDFAKEIVTHYLDLLEINDGCYNRNVELSMWGIIYGLIEQKYN